MKAIDCAQQPVVEALHDGRLGSREQASIERHMAACAACAAHRESLLAIRAHVRGPSPVLVGAAELTPLAHQRGRAALLRSAVNLDAGNVESGHLDESSAAARSRTPSPLRARFVPFALAAAFAAITLFVGWSWGRSTASVGDATARASVARSARALPLHASVDPESGARFERARVADADEVKLSTGTLRVRCGAAPTEHLVVRVGDAVLKPKESVFRVTAEAGEIRSVVVEEGSVELEVAGYYAEIPAGGSWRSSASSTVAAASVAPPSAPPASAPSAPPAVALVTPPDPAPRFAPTPRDEPSPTPAATTPPVVKKPNGFSSAMRTMEQGDYRAAAEQMAAFADAHPGDPRADEADYMRAIALERAGRVADAKAAAKSYLAKWPSGAHRAEAAAIAAR